MIILLYKPGEIHPFRKYDASCDVVTSTRDMSVGIFKDGKLEENFKLIRKEPPLWTDETKAYDQVMVKLIVEESDA